MHEEIRRILQSPEFLEGLKERVVEEQAKWQREARTMLQKHYPEHVAHNRGQLAEGDWEYFDAMFVSYEIICGCGCRLLVTREML